MYRFIIIKNYTVVVEYQLGNSNRSFFSYCSNWVNFSFSFSLSICLTSLHSCIFSCKLIFERNIRNIRRKWCVNGIKRSLSSPSSKKRKKRGKETHKWRANKIGDVLIVSYYLWEYQSPNITSWIMTKKVFIIRGAI